MLPIFDVFDYFNNVKRFVDDSVVAPAMNLVNPVTPTVIPPASTEPIITAPIQQTQPAVPTITPVAPIVPTVEVVPIVKNVEPVVQVFPTTGAQPITSQDPTNDNMNNFGVPPEQDTWKGREDTINEFSRGGGVKQRGSSSTPHDKVVKAKRVGYRFTDKKAKRLGKSSNTKPTAQEVEDFKNGKGVYYENRKNRSDKKRGKKL